MSQKAQQITVPASIISAVYEHCLREAPNEACGMLFGSERQVECIFPLENKAASPVRYLIDPREMLKLSKMQREKSYDLKVIYHSHTHSEAYPSSYDREVAFHTDAVYMIVTLQDELPAARAFTIKGEFTGDTMKNTEIDEIRLHVDGDK